MTIEQEIELINQEYRLRFGEPMNVEMGTFIRWILDAKAREKQAGIFSLVQDLEQFIDGMEPQLTQEEFSGMEGALNYLADNYLPHEEEAEEKQVS